MRKSFSLLLFVGMMAGILVGWACHSLLDTELARATYADRFSLITDIFLRLIRMIIAPLVFATLVSGIAHLDDSRAVGRIGLKTMAWFLGATVVSLTLGLLMVQWLEPGAGMNLVPGSGAESASAVGSISLKEVVVHAVPTSLIDAMARNEILQIVVFAVLFAIAMTSVAGRAPAVLALTEQTAAIMLKVTGYVMTLAPIAIFAALAATITTHGLDILGNYAKFIGGFYLTLVLFWAVLLMAAYLVIGARAWRVVPVVAQPTLLAFSTASSEAAYPGVLESLQKFGVPKRIVSFVLPLGYSFNLDGSMVYCVFASLFIAQAYNIDLGLTQQITLLLVLAITSKGIAGVPRAALVVVAATLGMFGLPPEGIALVLAVDHVLDMGRSATNVIGNSVAATVVAQWEGSFAVPQQPQSNEGQLPTAQSPR